MVSLAMTAKPLMLSGGLYNERVGTQTTLSCIAHAREVEFEKKYCKAILFFANGNRAIDAVICRLTVFGGSVE